MSEVPIAVIGIGGGSTMDVAKALSVLLVMMVLQLNIKDGL